MIPAKTLPNQPIEISTFNMPKVSTPVTGTTGLPSRRKERKPRVLSYSKCRFCRDPKVKSKCIWDQGSWPNKCRRCFEKNLVCSPPLHKAEERWESSRARPPNLPALSISEEPIFDGSLEHRAVSTDIIEESTELNDIRILQLLALRSMILMALEDYVAICESLLEPMKHDPVWEQHAHVLYRGCSAYEQFARALQNRIDCLAPHSKLAISAALDLEHFSCAPRLFLRSGEEARAKYHQYTDSIIDGYHGEGHHGIVTVLLMRQFLRFGVITDRLPVFFECRRNFMTDVATFMSSDVIEEVASQEHIRLLEDSQLFIPGTLLRHPQIRRDYEDVGLKDCLGRSVALRKYDAGIIEEQQNINQDPYDCMGRTLLHAACARDDDHVIDPLITKGLICATKSDSGLSPLHIAAMRAPKTFEKLYLYYKQLDDFSILVSKVDVCDRTILEWAASCGHNQIFRFLLSTHNFQWYEGDFIDHVNEVGLSKGMVMTLLELALHYNHSNIVETIMRQAGDELLKDDQDRTPLWYAAHYKCFDAWRFLVFHFEGHDIQLEIRDKQQRTPLMEAARMGFDQGLEFLLGRPASMISVGNPWLRDLAGKTALELAQDNGHAYCTQLLMDWESDYIT
ncbi:hypothetical protein DPSP01_002329 [Paraphaeosphaeria sporulosa]